MEQSKKGLLSGRVAVVTGGSRGIGREIAAAIALAGAKTAIAARTEDPLWEAVACIEANGGTAIPIIADISKPSAAGVLAATVLNAWGHIDVLVNCAGIQAPVGEFRTVDIDRWEDNFRVNLFGSARCSRVVLPAMVDRGFGRIINLSGGGATSPRPCFSGYGVSKCAIVRFTETLAAEVARFGVTVNAIAPGAVKTRMTEEVIAAGEKAGRKEVEEAEKTMQKGGADPAEAAALAVFLASDKAGHVTGRLISAVWDDWRNLDENGDLTNRPSLYTLRRIDERNFFEKPV